MSGDPVKITVQYDEGKLTFTRTVGDWAEADWIAVPRDALVTSSRRVAITVRELPAGRLIVGVADVLAGEPPYVP